MARFAAVVVTLPYTPLVTLPQRCTSCRWPALPPPVLVVEMALPLSLAELPSLHAAARTQAREIEAHSPCPPRLALLAPDLPCLPHACRTRLRC